MIVKYDYNGISKYSQKCSKNSKKKMQSEIILKQIKNKSKRHTKKSLESCLQLKYIWLRLYKWENMIFHVIWYNDTDTLND